MLISFVPNAADVKYDPIFAVHRRARCFYNRRRNLISLQYPTAADCTSTTQVRIGRRFSVNIVEAGVRSVGPASRLMTRKNECIYKEEYIKKSRTTGMIFDGWS